MGNLQSTVAINGDLMKIVKESLIILLISAIIVGFLTLIGNLTRLWTVASFGEYAYVTFGVALVVGISTVARKKTTEGNCNHED